MQTATFRIWRGDSASGEFVDYTIDIDEGMVVLDAVHQIQASHAPDLAVRWNCKAGKCGSCSAEVNGKPCLMCMTRLEDLRADAGIPPHEGPGYGRVLELHGQEEDQALQAPKAGFP